MGAARFFDLRLRVHFALLVGVVALVAAGLWARRPAGIYAIDEAHYTLAAAQWARAHTHAIANGYGRYPTPLLLILHPSEGEVAPAKLPVTTFIPPLYTFIAAPFYAALGIDGLVLLNLLGFAAIVLLGAGLSARLAARPARPVATMMTATSAGSEAVSARPARPLDPGVLWLAALALVTATYLADYAVSVMNHALSLALLLAGVAFHPVWWEGDGDDADTVVEDSSDNAPRRSPAWRTAALAFASGLVLGLSIGIRLQNVVFAGVAGAMLFWRRRTAWPPVGAYLAGLLPPLLAIAAVNHARFGVWNPFTYGMAAQTNNVPLLGALARRPAVLAALAGVAVVAACAVHEMLRRWATGLPADRRATLTRRALLACSALPLLALAALWPVAARFGQRVVGVALFGDWNGSWLALGPSALWVGRMNALAQSCPLALWALVAPFLVLLGGRGDARLARFAADRRFWLLAALVWANALFVSLLTNDGGHLVNNRYLLEAAVLGTILFAAALPVRELAAERGWLAAGAALAVAQAAAIVWALAGKGLISIGRMETEGPIAGGLVWYTVLADRLLPLLVGAGVVAALALDAAQSQSARAAWARGGRRVAALLVPSVLLVPGVAHWAYDMRAVDYLRDQAELVYRDLDASVEDDSLLVMSQILRASAVRLKATKDVWVANADRTEWEGVEELLTATARDGARRHFFLIPMTAPPGFMDRLKTNFDIYRVPVRHTMLFRLVWRDAAPDA